MWLQAQNQCQSKECVKEALQKRIKELISWNDFQKPNNAWNGTWILKQNLYEGELAIRHCDKSIICEIEYNAMLHKSEFNDIHICESVLMRLEIKNNKAIAYYDGKGRCSLDLELTKNGVVITGQKPKDCYMGCGVGTEIMTDRLYHKE